MLNPSLNLSILDVIENYEHSHPPTHFPWEIALEQKRMLQLSRQSILDTGPILISYLNIMPRVCISTSQPAVLSWCSEMWVLSKWHFFIEYRIQLLQDYRSSWSLCQVTFKVKNALCAISERFLSQIQSRLNLSQNNYVLIQKSWKRGWTWNCQEIPSDLNIARSSFYFSS